MQSGTPTPSATPPDDANLSADARRRIQAKLGNMKEQESKIFVGRKNEKLQVDDKQLPSSATLYVGNCENCEIEIDAICTKILVEGCKGTKLRLNGGVLTNMLEMWRCQDVILVVNTRISTVQLDLCKKIDIQFTKRDLFDRLVWAALEELSLVFHDAAQHSFATGLAAMRLQHPDLNLLTDQFIVRFLDNSLHQERIIRLANGFPSTQRETDVFDENQKRKDEYMRKKAEDLVKLVPKRYLQGPKVGPNELCTCKSGKKYKKCCGATATATATATADAPAQAAPAPAAEAPSSAAPAAAAAAPSPAAPAVPK